MTIVEMCVHMDCAGCETKIKKALKKLPGVDDVDIDMRMQKVTVMGWADQKKVLKTVRKTGKRAELWPYPYNPEYHGFSRQYYTANTNNYDNNNNHFYSESNSSSPSSYSYSASNYSKPSSSSSYNYYKHGYSYGEDFGYYRQPIGATMVSDKAMSMFSDDNPHACSIM